MITSEAFHALMRSCGVRYAEAFQKFVEGQVNRMVTSSYKYGPVNEETMSTRNLVKTLELRWAKYLETHNTEFLMDVANFCAMEFLFPTFPDASFRATDSHESPGVVDYKGRVTHKHFTEID